VLFLLKIVMLGVIRLAGLVVNVISPNIVYADFFFLTLIPGTGKGCFFMTVVKDTTTQHPLKIIPL
jgi:hypothetical protein